MSIMNVKGIWVWSSKSLNKFNVWNYLTGMQMVGDVMDGWTIMISVGSN